VAFLGDACFSLRAEVEDGVARLGPGSVAFTVVIGEVAARERGCDGLGNRERLPQHQGAHLRWQACLSFGAYPEVPQATSATDAAMQISKD
jgi:hypothetical protein